MGQQAQTYLRRVSGAIDSTDRARVLRQEPATIWLTGLSGSGKSTLAYELEHRLVSAGHACYVLDGDNVRHGLSADLGFGAEDRRENIRRVAHVAQLLNDAGLIVITALISPMHEDRMMAREIIGSRRFIETYLSASVEICTQRDPKGLYAMAHSGKISSFTGVSAPYEAPTNPGLLVETANLTISASVALLYDYLDGRYLNPR